MYRDPFEHRFDDLCEAPPPVVFYETPKSVLVPNSGERLLTLTKGHTTLIDEEDFALVDGLRFAAHQARSNIYARHRRKGYLHRLIVGATNPSWVVDHKNRNSLDNRRHNLKVCGFGENAQNADYAKASSTGYRGVYKAGGGKFYAQIGLSGTRAYLGTFSEALDAAIAYDKAALDFYGPFAWTNLDHDVTPKPAVPVSEIPF